MLFKVKNEKGQTLVDLVISIALIALSVTAAGALASTSSRNGGEAGRRSQATALATREMEAVRNYRDNLTRLGRPFSQLSPGNCRNFYMRKVAGSVDQTGWQLINTSSPVAYSNATAGEVGYDSYSSFSRIVRVCSTSVLTPNQKNIHVIVSWDEGHGPKREVTFKSVIAERKQ